ncbi:MAG: hypothetical protein QXX68_02580 [Candidatus Pacearchaeota archaeon]
MISIAAIGIIAAIVVPMIRDNLSSGQGCFKALSDISLDREVTCVSYNGSNSHIIFGIQKGPETSVEVAKIQVILYKTDGSSIIKEQNTTNLEINTVKVYNTSFNSNTENYTAINIVPVLKIGNKLKNCEAPKERIPLVACSR